MGHHDKFSPREKERVVDEVSALMIEERLSVFKALPRIGGAPAYVTFTRWLREDEGLAMQIAHARETLLEAYIEEMIEIADDKGLDHNDRRVRILAREKAAQMLAPRRFAIQRMDVTSGGEKLPAPSDGAHARLDRIEALLSLAAARASGRLPSPMIDVTPEPTLDEIME